MTDWIGSNESPFVLAEAAPIAFTSTRNGKAQVFTVDRDGNNLRQIRAREQQVCELVQ